jgi:hypothetical protein
MLNWQTLPYEYKLMLAILGFIFVTVVFFVVVKLITIGLHKIELRRKQNKLEEDRARELERLARLPKLRTDFLFRVPGKNNDDPRNARSYGSRYNRLIIFDEYGRMFVGLRTKEIMADLVAGDFVLEGYRVPFCGPGEAYVSKEVEIDGHVLDLYPLVMYGLPPSDPRWKEWLRIELNYAESQRSEMEFEYPEGWNARVREIKRLRDRLGVLALAN